MEDPARSRVIARSSSKSKRSVIEPLRKIALQGAQSCKSAWLNDDAKGKSTCRGLADSPGAITFPVWKGKARLGGNSLADWT